MASSLSNFLSNLSGGIHIINCKVGQKVENVKHAELNISIAINHNLVEYKCLCCNKNYEHKFEEKLKERFFNTYKFSNHENNTLILLLRLFYPYEYMNE